MSIERRKRDLDQIEASLIVSWVKRLRRAPTPSAAAAKMDLPVERVLFLVEMDPRLGLVRRGSRRHLIVREH